MDGREGRKNGAGHNIGRATVHLKRKQDGKTTRISLSGDEGRYNDAIRRYTENLQQADYILLESKYGNKLHTDVSGSMDTLLGWIQKTCIVKKGKLIIPAFSVGRTQELLFMMNQMELDNRLPAVPVYVESPLSRKATDVVKA